MLKKSINSCLESIATFEDVLAKAKRRACCMIAEALEHDHNDMVESVRHRNTDAQVTFEEVMEDGHNGHDGRINPYWGAAVTLFLKEAKANKTPQEYVVRPFRLSAMKVVTPPKGQGYADDVLVKFQLIGFYLDSEGSPKTMRPREVTCYLIERCKGLYPEFMLEEEYQLYGDRKLAA
jgi:hypothetical protein